MKPANPSGRKPALSAEQLARIAREIDGQPDVTPRELIDGLNLPVCVSALCRTVKNKLGYRFKKTRHAAEQNRADVKARREEWKTAQPAMNAGKLVFLDESSVNTGMTRLYGRGMLGARVIDYVPDVRFERISILSSVRLNGDLAPPVFEGSLNGELFKEYVSECLAPMLQKGDVVIMDNLTSHKVKGVAELTMAAGAHVVYLPPYSPDLNPVEMMRSKVKAHLRKAKARTRQALDDAIAAALGLVSQTDISGWFDKDGYGIQ
jgi:transposase